MTGIIRMSPGNSGQREQGDAPGNVPGAGPLGGRPALVKQSRKTSTEEAINVRTRLVLTLTFLFVAFGIVAPIFAQGAAPAAGGGSAEMVKWSIITAGFALGFAAAFGALGQSRGLAASVEAIARNPSANADIRFALLLGLVLIESLVIYVLLVSLILFFVKPFAV
jgi:F-type H+-transporting ATPase subunit c